MAQALACGLQPGLETERRVKMRSFTLEAVILLDIKVATRDLK